MVCLFLFLVLCLVVGGVRGFGWFGTALQAFKPAMWGFWAAERADAQVAAARLAAQAAWRVASVQGRAGFAP